jgi:hypothetical protein
MATKQAPAEQPVETTEVELLRPHTHNGQKRQAGDKISVTAAQRQFLCNHKLIEDKS